MISNTEAVLIFRGWAESKSRLRMVVQYPTVTFASFCSIWKVDAENATFLIGPEENKTVITFSLVGLGFDFADAPNKERAALAVGVEVESGIVAVGQGLRLVVMLLK